MKNRSLFLLFPILLSILSCTQNHEIGYHNYSDYTFDGSGDQYEDNGENPFVLTDTQAISTFSVDADGGSYANVKRYIMDEGVKPPAEAVRVEELINYFPMDYADPGSAAPIALNGEVSACPWNAEHRLIRIGIKGRSIPASEMPASNWVLLIDVSGSMSSDDKLDLIKEGMKRFVDQSMRPEDRLAIVTYSGASGVELPSTPGTNKAAIKQAISRLKSGGSTNGAQGIITAYDIAQANFISGGNNRILLATDGDFNVGISTTEALVELIEQKRDLGIFLTAIGVGRGNLNDAGMEQLANNGNGTYEYMGDIEQAEKVLVHEASKFFTVAKDVKVQVEFNPDIVKKYRLIGYENRVLQTEDFEDDQKDAGEIGAGQTVTALYEIELAATGGTLNLPVFSIDFRYKDADANESQPLTLAVYDEQTPFLSASENMRFCAATAGFGMLLRDSPYKGTINYDQVIDWANNASSFNPQGYRQKFIQVVQKAKTL